MALKGHAVMLVPYFQVQMTFLNSESIQTFVHAYIYSVYDSTYPLQGTLHFGSRILRTRVQSEFSLTNALLKGVLNGTTLTLSI